jgi:lipopolysaccharide transport protein LptA
VTGADSKNSNWTLSGQVQIAIPQGHLSADHATMKIVNDRITTLTAEHAPAQCERYNDGPAPADLGRAAEATLEHVHGYARQITYDVDHDPLELNGDAYVIAGCYEFSSESIIYDIANHRVQTDPRDNSPVKGIIKRGTSGCGPGADKP